MELSVLAILAGFLLDLILGDPVWLPHPVRWIGYGISKGEKAMRRVIPATSGGEGLGGGLLALIVIGGTFAVTAALLLAARTIHPWLGFGLETVMCYQILATKSLKTESMRVYRELAKGDVVKARHYLSWIVGRDTDKLSEEGIVKAAVETVAENTADGVIAPLFYLALGGPALGMAYKAVNTLDSMIGYKNERYLFFGRTAARIDDAANYIPSRLAGLLMVAAAFMLPYDGKGAWKILRRDRQNHSSPNSAHTEAACAGALGIELGGDAFYFGKPVRKKTIGDKTRAVEARDILRAHQLLYMTAFLGLALALAARFAWDMVRTGGSIWSI